ncbi:MAG TPA: type II secretion system protein N [Verrucomicrobiae bacterium]|nr:type II secretion system protein N [Verrucomicrobiae bacterium]
MIARRWLILLGTLAFLATLVLHAPAALVYGWTRGKAPGPTAVHGLHGTVASGGFSALTVNNRRVIGEARWDLHPAWLALLRLSADIESNGDTSLRVGVSRGIVGATRLSDLVASGSVKALLGSLGQSALPLEGQARLDLPLLKIRDGLPTEARGSAELENLSWTLSREPLALGSFTADLSTGDAGIRVDLTSGAGPLELTGNATLAPDHAYDLHLQLRPRDQAAPQLLSLLRSLGAPDAQGWYHIRRNGSLAPPAA